MRVRDGTLTGPAVSFGLALIVTGVALVGQLPVVAALSLGAVMVAYGLVLLVMSRRSETVRLLAQDIGSSRDEREHLIHLRAAALSYFIVVALAIAMFLIQLAHGDASASPWVVVGAVAGLSYCAGLVLAQRQG